MKNLAKLFICLSLAVYINSSLFAQKEKPYTYNSKKGQVLKFPKWYTDINEINLRRYKIKKIGPIILGQIITASGSYIPKDKTDNGFEGSEKLAWANARKRFFDSWVSVFTANDATWGSNADARISETKSLYNFLTENVKGVSPLSKIETYFTYDTGEDVYTCFAIYYLRKDEFDKRLKEWDQNKNSRANFEKIIDGYDKKLKQQKTGYDSLTFDSKISQVLLKTPAAISEDLNPFSDPKYFSDNEYFREIGFGEGKDMEVANDKALMMAENKLGGAISTYIAKITLQTAQETKIADDSKNKNIIDFENKLMNIGLRVIEQTIVDKKTIGQKYTNSKNNNGINIFTSWVALETAKKYYLANIINAVSSDKILNTDFKKDLYTKLFSKGVE